MFSASDYDPHTAPSDTFTILVIEDDSGNRLLTCMTLKTANYVCHCASSIEEGRDILHGGGIDLVISDLMFEQSPAAALALLEDMRADPDLARIPVIVATGERSTETKRSVMALGAAGVLTKPYSRGDLLTLVRQCLDGKQA